MSAGYALEEHHRKNSIYKNLHLGTNMPILKSFQKFIYNEIDRMGCFSLVIKNIDSNEILGHVMLYPWEETLYFAFFYAKDATFEHTNNLILEIEQKAQQMKCKKIFGPVNLPPYIYGFGFSESGSDDTIFAMAPVTNPSYIEHFKKLNYETLPKILHYRIPLHPISFEGERYDIRFADLSNPEEWKDKFLELQHRLYPPHIQITPNRGDSFYDVLEFLDEYSNNDSVFLFYDDNGILSGVGWCSPNPFDLGKNGKVRSFVLFGVAIEKKYQKMGIGTEGFIKWINHCTQYGVTHGEGFTTADNKGSIQLFTSAGGKHTRTHVLMTKKI